MTAHAQGPQPDGSVCKCTQQISISGSGGGVRGEQDAGPGDDRVPRASQHSLERVLQDGGGHHQLPAGGLRHRRRQREVRRARHADWPGETILGYARPNNMVLKCSVALCQYNFRLLSTKAGTVHFGTVELHAI